MRVCGRKLRWNFLERRLSEFCRRYSLVVADCPLPFIIIPVIITVISLGGWPFKNEYKDAGDLYTPQGAKSRSDQQLITSLFPQVDGNYLPGKLVLYKRECTMVIVAKDGGNILRSEPAKAIEKLNDFVMNDVVVHDSGQNYTYHNLCMKSGQGCYNNPYIYFVPYIFITGDPYSNLSFPTATRDGRESFYLGASLGGVTLDPVSRHITNAKAWYLTYKLKEEPAEINRLSKMFELEYLKKVLAYQDPIIEIYPFHSQSLDLEVSRNADSLTPRFVLMLSMLVLFAVLCTLTWTWPSASTKAGFAFPVIDWTLSRPMLAFLGVIGAGMGVASAIGFLFYGRSLYNNIICVMPFLIIAVRLDNTFLMIAALDNTKRSLPVRERVSEAMSEAAVSITLTVLTDIFSFAFGVLTDFLAVQIFCIYTTLAIIITWIYQLTFLLGFLVLYAGWEEKHKHAAAPCLSTLPISDYESVSILTKLFCIGSRPPPVPSLTYVVTPVAADQIICNSEMKIPIDTHKIPSHPVCPDDDELAGTTISRWFRDSYGRFLMKKETKIGVMLLLLGFWAVSGYGCYNLRQGLEPIRLLVDDSYGIPYYRLVEEYFWDYGQQVQVVIFNPGDLSNATQRQTISDVVEKFANLPHATGHEGVDFWLSAFDTFLWRGESISLSHLPPDQFYEKLNWFLFSFKENTRYRMDVAFRNGSGPGSESNPIVAVRAMVGIQGFGTLSGQQETMDSFRDLAINYYGPSFNISVFHITFLFVDQYEDIWPNVAQEIYSSIACMIGMSLLLIPHPICAVWVTFAILSIDIGVIGFMTLWGLNMDTISMITIIMSIGFSVDFSAHIAYAYVVNIHEEPDDRVRKALGNLGWPVLQGGAATLLGVIFLADTKSYMIVSFFKTVFLVIAFGLMHGLIFLPVLLNLLMPKRLCGFQCIGSKREHGRQERTTHAIDTPAVGESRENGGVGVGAKAKRRIFPACKRWISSFQNSGKYDVNDASK